MNRFSRILRARKQIRVIGELDRDAAKIFCVGFNKTGTTSLAQFFEESGLRANHSVAWQTHAQTANIAELLNIANAFDTFSDGERADFRLLEALWPKARFVLNTRGLRGWLRSRIRHVYRVREGAGGAMATEYKSLGKDAVSLWIERRRSYYNDILAHEFRAGPLVMTNVPDDPEWSARLSHALNLTASAGKIHGNKSEPKTSNELLVRHYAIVDEALNEYGVPEDSWNDPFAPAERRR